MLSGEQIGAHPVRSVTGASNVRRLTFGETKVTGARQAVQPVRYRLAWPIGSEKPIGAAGFPVSTHEFPVPAKQIPCSVQNTEFVRSALELQRKWTPERGKKRRNDRKFQEFPVNIPVLSSPPGLT